LLLSALVADLFASAEMLEICSSSVFFLGCSKMLFVVCPTGILWRFLCGLLLVVLFA
jgi:hypothetical protein